MLRAASYARYSSDRQRPTSIEDQLALCRAGAERLGCRVLAEHVYSDREVSGSDTDRPGYRALLAAARAGVFEAILVEAQDRLWRNQAEMHAALRRLRFWSVKVYSVTTSTELTSESGGLLASVVGWKDEQYVRDLAEKTRRGLAGQVRRGLHAGGRIYGYLTEPVADPDRLDAHGQPQVVGYRLAVRDPEATIVRRIFEHFAAGWTTRRIAHALNREGIAPPRGRSGWTWTAIYGNPKLGTGILNNRLYVGEVAWNRFRWEKDPETGRRVPRLRDRIEWVVQPREDLRIVPQELWDLVKQQQHAVSARVRLQPYSGGRAPKYLFSGLLVCGICGGHFIMRDASRYACSYHVNRGASICRNTLSVRRQLVEHRLLETIRTNLFTDEAIGYIVHRVNEGLRRQAREQQRAIADRRQLEDDLRATLEELDHIREAIRRGLLTGLTRQLLEEAEARARDLRAKLEAPAKADLRALQVLPRMVRDRLADLERVLAHDVTRAREALRGIVGEIVLRPTPKGLVAELQGNLRGLLALGEQTPMLETLVAGAGFEPATFGL